MSAYRIAGEVKEESPLIKDAVSEIISVKLEDIIPATDMERAEWFSREEGKRFLAKKWGEEIYVHVHLSLIGWVLLDAKITDTAEVEIPDTAEKYIAEYLAGQMRRSGRCIDSVEGKEALLLIEGVKSLKEKKLQKFSNHHLVENIKKEQEKFRTVNVVFFTASVFFAISSLLASVTLNPFSTIIWFLLGMLISGAVTIKTREAIEKKKQEIKELNQREPQKLLGG